MPKKGYKQTKEHSKKIAKKAKERFKDPKNHPMYNKNHTKETIEKIKLNNGKYWLNKHLSKEHKEKLRKSKLGIKLGYSIIRRGKGNPNYGKKHPGLNSGKDNVNFGKAPSHGKREKYKDVSMRSSWEVAYAKYLDKNKIKWLYESKCFKITYTYKGKKKEGTYRPDFYLAKNNTYIEIKGWWRDDAKVKYRAFKRLYPKIKIELLMKKDLEGKRII